MESPISLLKNLADETRLNATLLIHAEGELCVCELTEALSISQPKISRHLAQLRSSGLLKDHRRGQWVYYSLNPNMPDWARNILAEAAAAEAETVTHMQRKLKGMPNRPCN